jgi:outer membrane protein assembly factor BamB
MYQMTPAHNPVLRDGPSVHWIVDIEKKSNGGMALADGNLFYDDFSGKVTAVNATTGNRLWSAAVGSVVMSTPVVADNMVFIGTGRNGRLHQGVRLHSVSPQSADATRSALQVLPHTAAHRRG